MAKLIFITSLVFGNFNLTVSNTACTHLWPSQSGQLALMAQKPLPYQPRKTFGFIVIFWRDAENLGFIHRYSSVGAWCQRFPASLMGSHIFQSSRAVVKITFNHEQQRGIGVICLRITMRILILSFIPSQELTGLVLLELCALPLMNCRKVGMLTKSSQMGGFNIYIFSLLHFMKVRALSHILSLQILIFLTGTFSLFFWIFNSSF